LNATYIETMEARKSKWRILLPTPEDWHKVFVEENSSWFQDAYARCRNMHLENDEVFQNAKKVFATFGTELALKFLRTDGFAFRLGQVGTAKVFVEKLLRVFEKYCGKDPKLFAQIACHGLFAHLLDADFFEKMDEFFEKYCGNEPELFAQLACDCLFAHLFDEDFFENVEYVFENYCDNKPALFAQLGGDGFFAHMNKDTFREYMDTILAEIFQNDHALLAQFVNNSVCARIWKAGYADKLVSAFQKSELDPTRFAQIGGNSDFHDKLVSPEFDAAVYFSTYQEYNKWSDKETKLLLALGKEFGGIGKWNELAEKHFPTRNAIQLRNRWNNLQKTTTKGSWSNNDDLELIKLHNLHPDKWTKIGSLMTEQRNASQVIRRFNLAKAPNSQAAPALRKYARGYENVNKKKFKKWTPEEEDRFIEAYKETPNEWAKMSKKFPGRSRGDLKMKWRNASTKKKKNPSAFEKFARDVSQKKRDIGK